MANAVDWATAERVARRIAARGSSHRPAGYGSIHSDFEELTAQAQTLVESHTGWTSEAGLARARVVDRDDWIRANIASFQRMLRPLTDRMEEKLLPGPANFFASRIAGAEMGAVLGWMSTRVLGQYDLLVLEDEDPDDQDIVYYVGPNIAALEQRFEFPEREFRLWVALHEVTHRTQFTGKPWLRHYFLEQVSSLMTLADPDPARFFAAIGRLAEAVRTRTNPLDDGGIVTLFATAEQRRTMDRVGGLMSLLEGHGDVTMDRAGGDRIPSAGRFGEVLRTRRSNASAPAKLLQKLIGIDAKLAQYEQGERFIEAVEAVGGDKLLERAFSGPDALPTLAEIRQPDAWLARIGAGRLAAAGR
ncbi:MAG: zinc-dependent metalloprotease [Acidimicrobiales bacterium]